jgi:hypothetical protein
MNIVIFYVFQYAFLLSTTRYCFNLYVLTVTPNCTQYVRLLFIYIYVIYDEFFDY